MAKLNQKQRANYEAAEEHCRQAFGPLACLWEIPKPKGTPYAMLAGFSCLVEGKPCYFVIAVYEQQGWEFFAAPRTIKIDETLKAAKTVWGAQ